MADRMALLVFTSFSNAFPFLYIVTNFLTLANLRMYFSTPLFYSAVLWFSESRMFTIFHGTSIVFLCFSVSLMVLFVISISVFVNFLFMVFFLSILVFYWFYMENIFSQFLFTLLTMFFTCWTPVLILVSLSYCIFYIDDHLHSIFISSF